MIFGAGELARRRVALVARSSALRGRLAADAAPFVARAAAAERIVATVQSSLPWVARAVALYTVLKRRA